MTTYVPERFPVHTSLDERGFRLGLARSENEDIVTYRRRLLLEARQPSGPSTGEYVNSVSRKVGLFDTVVGEISLDPAHTAVDPVLEITASRLLCWSDYANGVLEVDCLLTSRDREYFLTDVVAAVNASTNFVWTWVAVEADYEFSFSRKLVVTNNLEYQEYVALPDNFVFGLPQEITGFPRELRSGSTVFSERVATGDLVVDDGDYAFEADEDGRLILTSALSMKSAYADLYWSRWPVRISLAGVRAWSYGDADTKYRHQDFGLEDSTGEAVPMYLNADGSGVAAEVLAASPLEWGE